MCYESERNCIKFFFLWWWFSFRYGDRIPKSIPARSFAFLWTWTGIATIAVVTSSITASLMSMVFRSEKMLYGTKVGALDKPIVTSLNFKLWKSMLWIEISVTWKKNNITTVTWNIMTYVIRYLEFNQLRVFSSLRLPVDSWQRQSVTMLLRLWLSSC